METKLFNYKYIDNQAPHTLVLLHGTGGDENDLLPLVEPVTEKYNFLSLRGNILEDNQPRFFARSAPGEFDQQSIQQEVEKLHKFISEWLEENQLEPKQLAYLGYSNGANMLLALLFTHPQVIQRTILLHPMLPFKPKSSLNLSMSSVFITFSKSDPLIPELESLKVASTLIDISASVQTFQHDQGHQITPEEAAAAIKFLEYNI